MSEQDLAIANRDVPPQSDAAGSLAGRISQTIEGIVAFHEREQLKIGNSRRRLATVSGLVSRPLLITVLSLVVLWVSGNALAGRLGMTPFDPAPFPRLQGLLTPAAPLTTTVVLIAQNREARLESQRSHLGLQVNLLTEQKVTKLIRLLEELRRDLPMVKDRHDPEAVSLQRHADAAQVLAALEDVGVGSGGRKADAVKP
jgi:uncharacterized membrane protein